MKLIFTLIIVLIASGGAFAAESPLELRGAIVGGGATKLSLTDKTASNTRWVEVGQTFAGYTVKAYDAETETATLTKAGKELRLRLNAAQVATADSTTETPALSKQATMAILNNLRQISAAADQYFLETGKTSVTLAELVGPDKYIKQLKPIDGESYASLQLAEQGPTNLSVVTQSGVKVEYDSDTSFVQPLADNQSVSSGDTAAKFAQRWKLTLPELLALNPNVDWTKLKVGQSLKIK